MAAAVANTLRELGAAADVLEARAARTVSPGGYDAVILAGSVQAGRYQRPLQRWVKRNAMALGVMPSAFLSVCLGILQHDPAVTLDLGRILVRFEQSVGWVPGNVLMVAGALRWSRYGWLKRLAMKRIVGKTMGTPVDTSRDREFTDWEELRRFIVTFVELHELGAEAGLTAASP